MLTSAGKFFWENLMLLRCWLIGVSLLWMGLAQAELLDPDRFFFHPKLGDMKEELVTAKAEGKRGIMLFFEWDECPYCREMRAQVLADSSVQAYYRKHFLLFPIDTRGAIQVTDFRGQTMTEKEFALAQQVRFTPAVLFYDLTGKPVARKNGAARSPAEFIELGKQVIAGKPVRPY